MRVWPLLAIMGALLGAASCAKDEARPPLIGNEPGGPSVSGGGGGGGPGPTGDGGDAGGFVTAPSAIRGLAVTATDVYFLATAESDAGATADGGAGREGILARTPRAGGATQVVVAGGVAPRGLAFTGTSFLWIDDGPSASSLVQVTETSARVLASGLSSASTFVSTTTGVVVASAGLGSVNVDLVPTSDAGAITPLGVLQGNVNPIRIAIDASTLFLLVAESPGAGLYRLPLAGGVPENVWSTASGTPRDLAIAPGGGRAFVALDTGASSDVLSISLPSGAPQPLASAIDRPAQVAIDGADLFVTTGAGEILRVPALGGPTTTLATGLGVPSALAVASDALYVASDNRIVRVAR